MKVALCIFGQPRTFSFCFPSVKKHILEPYSPDVFIASDSQGDRINALYNPVAVEIHSQDEEWQLIGERKNKYGTLVPFPEFPQYPISPPHDLSFMYKGWRCGELLKEYEATHGCYDVVIVTRFDTKFLYVQPITMPEENCLYLPTIDACHTVPDERFYASHLYWGSSAIGKLMLNAYNWSDQCYNEIHRWCGEMMLKWACDRNNIKVQHTNVNFMLIRGDSEHPRSFEAGWGYPLSATNYPEYLGDK
jgi:hypothetical protein